MKVIIAGGGTGGHLYPGIAVARELLRERGNHVLFVGTEQGIEARVLPKESLPVRFIKTGRLKGMGLLSIAKTILGLPKAIEHAMTLVREEAPDIVVGLGGYASAAVGIAAWIKKIPLVIIEPNAYPGLANRMLGRLARKVVLPFPGANTLGFFREDKILCTGPLVRAEIEAGDRKKALKEFGLEPDRYTVLVFGGSSGAHAVNMVMKDAARQLSSIPDIQILHQTGEKDVEDVRAGYTSAGIKAAVVPYIYDMASAYALADLVVSRAGATTVAELSVLGKPAVLIPYPFAADNHQEYNARALVAYGDAKVILQQDLTPEKLAAAIEQYRRTGRRGTGRMDADAALEIVDLLRRYVQKN